MPFPDILLGAVGVCATAALGWAAVSDIRLRRIPNQAVIALVGLAVAWIVGGGASPLSALEAMGIALVVTVALYLFKIIGAGDSKLFAATALFAGLGYLPALTVGTTLAGGAIALISFASRPQRALVMITLRGRGDYGRGVPYGCAIAIGGAIVIWGVLSGLLPPFGSEPHATARSIAHGLIVGR